MKVAQGFDASRAYQRRVFGKDGMEAQGRGEKVVTWASGDREHVMVTVYNGAASAESSNGNYKDSLASGPNDSVTCKAGKDYAECWRGTGAIS